MKLSIITVNLNNAEGLRKTIDSVIIQNSQHFEYIIIDGGSTDCSVEVIKNFEDRITYWISEPDHGIYHAMNKGIVVAKGEYCQFLNSGDCLVSKNIIEEMILSMPDCSIFYGNMLKVFSSGRVFRDSCGAGNISMLSFYIGTLNHSPSLIRRSLFEKYGFYDESLRIVSDWKWFLITIGLYNEPIRYIDLDVTRFDMNGISNKSYELETKERREVLEELIPVRILQDYDSYSRTILQMNRISNYRMTKWLFHLTERILFKLEKWLQTMRAFGFESQQPLLQTRRRKA